MKNVFDVFNLIVESEGEMCLDIDVNHPNIAQKKEFTDYKRHVEILRGLLGEKKHNLTTLEMQLLKYFLDHAGKVLARHEILENVWDPAAEVTTRTIDNFVSRLRKILEPDPARPKYILSVRGTGYRFVAPVEQNT